MTWPELLKARPPLSIAGLLAFMERWKPGSTYGFEPATDSQIATLAQPHGGVAVLPRVYREFLATMGKSTGGLGLMWGTISILALLEEQQQERPDPRRYLKFAIGEDDDNGRHPDDFFDLTRPTPDGRDAAIIRIHEEHLVSGEIAAEQPFQTFSDLLRAVIVARASLEDVPEQRTPYYSLGTTPEAPAKAYEFFTRLGFSLTELGASSTVVPLEHPERGTIILIKAPTASVSSTSVRLRARDKAQHLLLEEIINDHQQELRGG